MTTPPAASPDPSTGTGSVPPYGQEAAYTAYTAHAPVPARGAPAPGVSSVPPAPASPAPPPPPPAGGGPEHPVPSDGTWGSPGTASAPWGSADPEAAGHPPQGYAAGHGYGAGQGHGAGQGYGAGQTYGPYPYGSYPASPSSPVPPRNELAVWSVVLGAAGLLLGCVFLTGVPAIVLGHRARRAAAEGEADNEALATAGIVLGWLATGLGVLVVLLVVVLAVVPLLTLATIGPMVDSLP